jgi:rubrerythrin
MDKVKKLDFHRLPETGEYGLLKDMVWHYQKTREPLTKSEMKDVGGEDRSRSGESINKYLQRLEQQQLVVKTRKYSKTDAYIPDPPQDEGLISHHYLSFRKRLADTLDFVLERRDHQYFECSKCGYTFRKLAPFLPRRPCPRCLAPAFSIYFKIFNK